MKANNITCGIEIDGQRAKEYGEEASEQGLHKSCYIASEEDKPFAFLLDITAEEHDWRHVCLHVCADGEKIDGAYMQLLPGRSPTKIGYARLQSPLRPGILEKRRLRFGKLNTAETAADVTTTGSSSSSSSLETRAEVIKDVGTLKVIVWECILVHTNPAPALDDDGAEASSVEKKPILEKQLKGRSVPHSTKLGDPSFSASVTYRTRNIEPPLATFVFKYTTEESLKNQLIIPPEEDAAEAEEDDEISSMSIDEMRRELRRRREAEAAEEDDLRRKVKREGQEPRRPLIPPGPVETIDLTEDD